MNLVQFEWNLAQCKINENYIFENINIAKMTSYRMGGEGRTFPKIFLLPPPGIAQAGDNSWEVGGTVPQTGISQGGGHTPFPPCARSCV